MGRTADMVVISVCLLLFLLQFSFVFVFFLPFFLTDVFQSVTRYFDSFLFRSTRRFSKVLVFTTDSRIILSIFKNTSGHVNFLPTCPSVGRNCHVSQAFCWATKPHYFYLYTSFIISRLVLDVGPDFGFGFGLRTGL